MTARKTAAALFLALLLAGTTAYAGDIPEGIMSGEHMAMFIGQITALGKDTITIQPLTVLMGEAPQGELHVKRFGTYSPYPHPPRKGDYLVALLNDEATVDESWVFQTTSADYKTLEIVIVGLKHDMVKRYERYINEGAYIEAQKKLDERKALGITDPPATAIPTPAPVSALITEPATQPPAVTVLAAESVTSASEPAVQTADPSAIPAANVREKGQPGNKVLLITEIGAAAALVAAAAVIFIRKMKRAQAAVKRTRR